MAYFQNIETGLEILPDPTQTFERRAPELITKNYEHFSRLNICGIAFQFQEKRNIMKNLQIYIRKNGFSWKN